jgi:hypothetical protein
MPQAHSINFAKNIAMAKISRKGVGFIDFVRIALGVALFMVSCSIVGKVYDSAKGGVGAQSSEKLANQLNSLSLGEAPQVLLTLDKESAIVGFSKNTADFRCVGCPKELRTGGNRYAYTIQKPAVPECTAKPCVCFCSRPTSAGIENTQTIELYKLTCKSFTCTSLSTDIPSFTSLEKAFPAATLGEREYPYWQNGFFFARSDSISNGVRMNSQQQITAYLESNALGKDTFSNACPRLPCVQDAPSP